MRGGAAPISLFFALTFSLLLLRCTGGGNVVVDGVAGWKNSVSVHVGDSLIFRENYAQTLYLLRDRRAFHLCDFGRASLLHNDHSSNFTWSPPRPGRYYLSTTAAECKKGEKMSVRVTSPVDLSPVSPPSAAPPPTSGGDLSSRGWGWVSSSPSSPVRGPSPAPETFPLVPREGAPAPAGAPGSGGGTGIPFLSSNPAVPLPTGVTDTASIRPLPTPGDGTQVVGQAAAPVGSGRLLVVSAMMCAALGLWVQM